ncbi:ABC transporter ATP-binding protein [Myxococcota bacterium]|nr:ABC transporter ATP-binding protein [Myxococcota bacterium]
MSGGAESSESAKAGSSRIEARGISKRYGDFTAVEDVSFDVGEGEVVGFLGPNGAGKTTTMRILTGFIPPTEGSAQIAGYDLFSSPLEARRSVGYLPESPPIYPEMSVRSYLVYVSKLKDLPRARRKEAVDKALERCGLTHVQSRVIGLLSKGYRQRVGLAQAIVHEPPVLVLDEPTVGLDPIQISEIRQLIADLAKPGEYGGQSVILSTHILAEVEAICRRVLIINEGTLVLDAELTALAEEGQRLEDVFTRAAQGESIALGREVGK